MERTKKRGFTEQTPGKDGETNKKRKQEGAKAEPKASGASALQEKLRAAKEALEKKKAALLGKKEGKDTQKEKAAVEEPIQKVLEIKQKLQSGWSGLLSDEQSEKDTIESIPASAKPTASTLFNKRLQTKKAAPKAEAKLVVAPVKGAKSFDARMSVPKSERKRRALHFLAPGTYTQIAQNSKDKLQAELFSKEMEEGVDVASKPQYLALVEKQRKVDPVPDVEWWDVGIDKLEVSTCFFCVAMS